MTLPDPWRHPRPEAAAHYLGLLADAPRRPLAICGPRQVGKTHFLTHDLFEAADGRGWVPVYVDLSGPSDPLGAINTALGGVLRRSGPAGHAAVTAVGALGLNVGLKVGPVALPPSPGDGDPATLLATRFAELLRLRPGRPVLLALDEAQTLARPGGGEAAMKALRTLFNGHPGAVLLLLAGSSRPLLMALAGDQSRTAFKLAAHMDFPVLGAAFVAHVAARHLEITQREVAPAELEWAFGQLLHRPGEMIDFVRFMITETPGAPVRTALAAFKEKNQPDRALQQRFDGCTPLQQALLMEVAGGHKLFARETRERVAARVGQPTALAPASVHNALQQLEEKGVLVKSLQRGLYQFDDEQMRAWVDQVARGARLPVS